MLYKKHSILFVLCLLLCAFGSTWGQHSADPFSIIYEDIDQWEGQGYISHLPLFRPLPEVVLAAAMREVIEKGDKRATKKAAVYLKEVNDFSVFTTISAFGRINSVGGDVESLAQAYGNGTLDITGSTRVHDIVSMAMGVGGHIIADKDAETHNEMRQAYLLGKSQNRLEELENIRIGAVSVITLGMTFSNRTSFTLGKENLFLHAGYMRRSIGPLFEDGIIASPLASQSGNLFVHWQHKKLAVTWALYSLSSSQEYTKFNYDEPTQTADYEISTRNKINKYFYYNSLTWYLHNKLEFSIFESVMFGNFNLGYILPIKIVYAVDSLSDFAAGNLMAGIQLKYKPVRTLTIPVSMLVDDISVSQYLRFNFYSKLKAAGEAAIQWNPFWEKVKEIKVGYQIVTPYTYTHVPTESNELYSTAYNTENHTHGGQHFATSLKPSSHRVYVQSTFTPFTYLSLGAFARLEQHSNASDGVLNGPLNDGSIIDDGYYSVYDDQPEGTDNATFQKRFDFLTGTIETKVETGLNFGFLIPIARKIDTYGNINYSYRYTNNYLLTSDVKLEGIFQMEIGLIIQLD